MMKPPPLTVSILLASLFENTPLCIATVVCPPQLYGGEWLHRAWEFCQRNGTLYHCLATQDGDYEELCIKPQNISAGSYAKYSRAAKRIYFEPCPSNLYQPSWQWSNLIYKCEREKTECVSDNTPGQLTCNDGTTSTDRACYCDYRNGYVASIYALGNPQKLRCYIPSIQSSRCAYIPCRGKKELNSAYECVPVCDPGMYRPDHSLNCVAKTSTSEKVTTFTDVMMYNSTTRPPSSKIVTAIRIDSRRRNARVSSLTFEKRKDKGSSVVVTVFVILAIILIFVSIAVFICMPKTYYIHRLRNCICKICCGKDPPEEEEPYPLPPIFSSRSTLTYRTPHSTPANSPYVTPMQTPKLQRARFENGGSHLLQVPNNFPGLKRTASVRHDKSSNLPFQYSGMRRLSKSESSLEIPSMAQLLMLKHLNTCRSSEKLAGDFKTARTKQSPLAKEVDNLNLGQMERSTQSLISGVLQQPDLAGSLNNSPCIIRKQIVYVIKHVDNAIVGNHGKMVVNKFGKRTDTSDEGDSDEENGEENEESELLNKARENEETGASLESSENKTALATLTTIDDAMNSLSDQVSGKYTIEDVQHDGHCVYHCVKKATGCKLSIKEMRNWVANYMEAHCNSFKECLSTQRKHHSDDIDTIWADYLYGVRNNEWGDYLVLVALANICDIKINVISTRTPNEVLAIKPSSNPRYSIYLGHLTDLSTDRDLHFVILRKQDSE